MSVSSSAVGGEASSGSGSGSCSSSADIFAIATPGRYLRMMGAQHSTAQQTMAQRQHPNPPCARAPG